MKGQATFNFKDDAPMSRIIEMLYEIDDLVCSKYKDIVYINEKVNLK